MRAEDRVANFREYNNSFLPSWYNWRLHVALNAFIFLLFFSYGVNQIANFTPLNFLILALFFFIWGVIEYFIHRLILHGPHFRSVPFKKEHSVFHHGYFTNDCILANGMHDLNRTLLRPKDILTVLLINFVLSVFLSVLIGKNWAALFHLAGISYLIVYEFIHAVCHYYSGKNKIFQYFLKHHLNHHNPRLKESKNFSIVFPCLDSFFGTARTTSRKSK